MIYILNSHRPIRILDFILNQLHKNIITKRSNIPNMDIKMI